MTGVFPTRFSIRTEEVRAQKALRWTILGRKGVPSGEQLRHYGSLLSKGDPLADDVAKWALKVGFIKARVLIDDALEKGIDEVEGAPDVLRQLFEKIEQEPLWLDRRLLKVGARACQRTGLIAHLVMRDIALMGGYANSAINKPLVFTGALDSGAYKRVAETRSFWIDCTGDYALERNGAGFQSIVKVRILHGFIRQRLLAHPDWRSEDWGMPISQGDMLATNTAYSVVFMNAMKALGFRFSREEREGIVHLWRYVAYLIGIDEAELVKSEQHGAKILYAVLASQPEADEDSRILCQALMNETLETADDDFISQQYAKFRQHIHLGFSRLFLGKKHYNDLGLPENKAWAFAPLLITFPNALILETARQVLPGSNRVYSKVGRAWIERWRTKRLGHKTAEYRPVVELAKAATKKKSAV